MTNHETGSGMTTLAVRLPVRVVGRLYVAADERNRDVSAIVYRAIENWLTEVASQAPTEQADGTPKSPKATGTLQLAEVRSV